LNEDGAETAGAVSPAAARASAPATAPGGAPSPLVRSDAAGDEPGHRSMTAGEITAAIDDLADLRDRGAISVADYEAKKADLLRRL
jgi:hypothetical protein